jgi:hypothetical protein
MSYSQEKEKIEGERKKERKKELPSMTAVPRPISSIITFHKNRQEMKKCHKTRN